MAFFNLGGHNAISPQSRIGQCAALGLLALGTATDAGVFRYDYTSQPVYCQYADPIDVCQGVVPGIKPNSPVYTGSLTFDESLIPGGTLANISMDLHWDLFFGGSQDGLTMTATIHSAAFDVGPVTLEKYVPGFYNILDWRFVGLTSISSPDIDLGRNDYFGGTWFGELLGYLVSSGDGGFSFSTDALGNIVEWKGYNAQGGSRDPWTIGRMDGSGGDGHYDGRFSDGPGTWTRSLIAGTPSPQLAPAPVPLPAGGMLLGGLLVGLAGLSSARRRRRV